MHFLAKFCQNFDSIFTIITAKLKNVCCTYMYKNCREFSPCEFVDINKNTVIYYMGNSVLLENKPLIESI